MNMISSPTKFNKYDAKIRIIMYENLWHLPVDMLKSLSVNKFFITTLDKYIDNVEPEEYPASYNDVFMCGETKYYVRHIFTSGQYLDDLHADKPETPIAFKLREIPRYNLRLCLVRLWDRDWTREELIRHGAIEI